MKTRLVSFIIPARNAAASIGDTLESIFKQDYDSYEVIVVDNGSSDQTAEIAFRFPDVQVICVDKPNRSLARNSGAAIAQGDYLAFIDADVILAPDWLKLQMQFLQVCPVHAVATKIHPLIEGESVLDTFRDRFACIRSQGTYLSLVKHSFIYPVINTSACLVTKPAWKEIGQFNESLNRNEDLDFSLRLFYGGYLLGGNSSALSYVQFADNSSFILGREFAYIKRSFYVGINDFLANSWKGIFHFKRCKWMVTDRQRVAVVFFAFLIDLSTSLGNLLRRILRRRNHEYVISAGPKTLKHSFHFEGKVYFLKKNITLIYLNMDVYLFNGTTSSIKLTPMQANILRSTLRGEDIDREQAAQIIKLGVFSEAC